MSQKFSVLMSLYIKLEHQEGRLEEKYARALEEIGMRWEMITVRKWKEYYSLAEKYQSANGSLDVSVD